jgi:hypothetical protein
MIRELHEEVDEGLTKRGVDDLQSQLDKEPRMSAYITYLVKGLHEEHEEWDESLASPFNDFQESGEDWNTDNGPESV